MKKYITFFFLLILGCAEPYKAEPYKIVQVYQPQYIVLRDIPENPSFVVIPSSSYEDEMVFADNIETALIKAGVKVMGRPTVKEVTSQKGIGQMQGEKNEANMQKSEATLIEKYFSYDDIGATYIILIRPVSSRLKIFKKDTQELLTSFNVTEMSGKKLDTEIYNVLKSIGIKVRI